jgi:hypothetical protein
MHRLLSPTARLFFGFLMVLALAGLQPSSALAVPTQFNTGDVLAGVGAGQIGLYSGSGTLRDRLDNTTGSSEQTGMCFDGDGNLYSTNFSANSMSKFNSQGELLDANFGSSFNRSPESCVVDSSGNIYVGQADGSADLLKFNTSGDLLDSFELETTARGTDWIDLSGDQCTLFYTSENSEVKRFNVCTDTQLADFASGLERPCFALRIRPNGEVMVACRSQVYRLSSSGSVLQTYPVDRIDCADCFLFALNLDPNGSSFWTGSLPDGRIRKVNIESGGVEASFTAEIVGGSMAGLAIVGEITVGRPTTPRPRPREDEPEDDPALITVVQRPMPNLQTNRASADYGVSSYDALQLNDGIVEYEIEIFNQGSGAAAGTIITMPFDPAEQRVLDAKFSQTDTFVSKVVTNSLEITTGRINGNGGVITGTVRLLTRPTATLGASLGERLSFRWTDARSGGTGFSNRTVLTVGETDNNQPTYPLGVTPTEGPIGATHVLGATIFVPFETVTVWYHTPDNRDIAVGSFGVDAEGRVGVEFTTPGLAPGNYFMVVYGNRSRLTGVGPFVVR